MTDALHRPLKVFLSYASQDKPAVRELSRRLVGEGWIDTWLDEKKLLPGQDWRLAIEEAVEDSDIIIICLSSNSVSKEGHVQKELRYAREIALEKPEGTIFIIPLRLDECEVPRGLRFYQWVDYFGEIKNNGYDSLVESLKVRYEQKIKLEEEEGYRQEKSRKESEAAKKIAREKAEKEATEKARLEAEELARQKTAKEKAERETAKKVAREKVEKDAAEKTRLEAEEKIRQKAAKEKAEREAVKKAARERVEKKAVEKARLEAEEQAQQKAAKEKAERKAAENDERKRAELANQVEKIKLLSKSKKESKKETNPLLWIIGFASIAIIIAVILNTKDNPSPSATSYTENTQTPLPPEITDNKAIGMVLVPSGDFTMGVDKTYASDNNTSAHLVYLDAYYIDKNEVSNGLYKTCVETGVCKPPKFSNSYKTPNYFGNQEFDNYPVIYVNWYMAKDYCEWRGARLPTEAEWEKAARSTDGRIYPWGDNDISCAYANYYGGSDFSDYCIEDTTPTGSYEKGKSIYGAYDMVGNVGEWVNSLYMPYPYSANDERENLTDTGRRIVRGGSWAETVFSVADRHPLGSLIVSNNIGFRCARDATP